MQTPSLLNIVKNVYKIRKMGEGEKKFIEIGA